jgi:polyphosphate kinase
MIKTKNQYINREISWLKFNDRVLQESADQRVPLIERLRFLGIFSNNLDEFFKVRYATVKRIVKAGKSGKSVLGGEVAKDLLEEITKIVIEHQTRSLEIHRDIEKELEAENIFLINEEEVTEEQSKFLKTYFLEKVSPQLMTIILNDLTEFPMLKDSAAYLAIKMVLKSEDLKRPEDFIKEKSYALIEIPKGIDRFVVLPR